MWEKKVLSYQLTTWAVWITTKGLKVSENNSRRALNRLFARKKENSCRVNITHNEEKIQSEWWGSPLV